MIQLQEVVTTYCHDLDYVTTPPLVTDRLENEKCSDKIAVVLS